MRIPMIPRMKKRVPRTMFQIFLRYAEPGPCEAAVMTGPPRP